MSDPKLNLLLTADDKTAAAFNALNNRLKNVESTAKKTTSSIQSFGKIAGGVFAADRILDYAKSVADTADTYKMLSARIKVVSDSTEEFKTAQEKLFQISQRTRTGFAETADLYAQMARGMRDMAVPQDTMLKLVEGINKAIIVSGTSTQAANAALIQLGQGFAAGALRGQEFMSVQEQAPVILETVRNGLGKTQAELKKMAEEGKLTNEAFIEGFTKGMQNLDKQFGQMPVTISQSIQMMKNSFVDLIGTIDQLSGASSFITSVATAVANLASWTSKMYKEGFQAQEIAQAYDEFILAKKKVDGLTTVLRREIAAGKDATRVNVALAKAVKELDAARAKARGLDATQYGDVISPPLVNLPKKTNVIDEKAIDKQNKYILNQSMALYKLILSGEEYAVLQARLNGVSEETARSIYRQTAAIEAQDDELDFAAQQFKKVRSESDAWRKQEKTWQDQQKNVVTNFRSQMKAYEDMLSVRNDGVFKTKEEIEYLERRNKIMKAYEAAVNSASRAGKKPNQERLDELAAERDAQLQNIEVIKQRAEAEKELSAGIKRGFNSYYEEVLNFGQLAEDATVRAFRGMEDALVSFVQTGKLNFGDLARSIIADMTRIYVRQSMIAPLMGMLGLGSSSVSPFALSYANVTSDPIRTLNATQGWTGSARASGGPVTGGKTYLVGEKGPELFTASSSGNITPNNQLGGGGVVVNQTINVSTGVQQTVRAEVMSLMPQIANAAKSAVADAKLRGGSYAAAMR